MGNIYLWCIFIYITHLFVLNSVATLSLVTSSTFGELLDCIWLLHHIHLAIWVQFLINNKNLQSCGWSIFRNEYNYGGWPTSTRTFLPVTDPSWFSYRANVSCNFWPSDWMRSLTYRYDVSLEDVGGFSPIKWKVYLISVFPKIGLPPFHIPSAHHF